MTPSPWRPKIKGWWDNLLEAVEGEPRPDEVLYDPLHVAGVAVVCLFSLGLLYWILWALLVCDGGLFIKVGPFLQVLFTSKTLGDYGYLGHPYELGVFEGWYVNVVGLFAAFVVLVGLWGLQQVFLGRDFLFFRGRPVRSPTSADKSKSSGDQSP